MDERTNLFGNREADNRGIARSAGMIGGMTLLSRFTGLARDIATAGFFGTGLAMSAFVVAYTIPNLFRKLLGEGALTAAFVPVFTGWLKNRGREESWRLAGIAITLLGLLLGALVALGWLVIGAWSALFPLDEKFELVARLLPVMLPLLFFVCLAALAMGILHSFRRFAVPAFAPIAMNLVWIGALFFLSPLFGPDPRDRIFGLAWGVLIGGMVQLAIHLPPLLREGFRPFFKVDFRHPAIRRIAALTAPGILGLAIVQLNVVVDKFLALLISAQAPASLFFANRLVQFPLGLFGIALATASLPVLSAQAAEKKMEDFKGTLSYVLRAAFMITLPAAAGLIILRRPIVRLLFQRGEFGAASTEATAWVVIFYSLGLIAFAGAKIVAQAFYSLEDTRTPVKVGVGAMLLNLTLNLLVVFNPWLRENLAEGGLALSTSLAAFFNFLALAFILRGRLGRLRGREVLAGLARAAVLSAAMAAAAGWTLGRVGRFGLPAGFLFNLAAVAAPIAAGAAVFILGGLAGRVREFRELRAAFGRAEPSR